MKCEIIMDLIPLYIDKMTSNETNRIIEEHLANCENCKMAYEEMGVELPKISAAATGKQEAKYKISKKMKLRKVIYAYMAVLVAVIAFCLIEGIILGG